MYKIGRFLSLILADFEFIYANIFTTSTTKISIPSNIIHSRSKVFSCGFIHKEMFATCYKGFFVNETLLNRVE